MKVPAVRHWLPWLGWVLLALAVIDLIGLRSRLLDHHPRVLGLLAALALLFLVVRLGSVAVHLRRSERPLRRVAEGLTIVGVVVAIAAGMANWLFGLQGFVVLTEGETVSLAGGGDLQRFDAGPLSRLEEMDLSVGLTRLELRPVGGSGFTPISHLSVWQGEAEAEALVIGPGFSGAHGSLRFFQGAFGFAPRIVVIAHGETLMDSVVPFTTRRDHPGGVSFDGSIEVEKAGLALRGSIDLRSLDEAMRGHATLLMKVLRDGVLLGEGELGPGHFAEVQDGFRVGFAGLEKWVEVDISRRNYGPWVVTGAMVAGIGALLWAMARWRSL